MSSFKESRGGGHRRVLCGICALISLGVFMAIATPRSWAQESFFRRGDADVDGVVRIADTLHLLEAVFLGSVPLPCLDAADSNDNGRLSIADAIWIALVVFRGEALPEPFEECGADPSVDDALGCAAYTPCDGLTPLCLSEDLLADILGPLPGFEFCLPAGLLDLGAQGLELSVCPEETAEPCGITETPGCPVELTSIEPFVDFSGRRVGIRLEGRVEDLPIVVTETLFNTTTTCSTDIGGAEDGLPFRVELGVPLLTEEVEPGVLEVIGTEPASVDNVDMALNAEGGLVCSLFEAAEPVFIPLLLAPLEQLAQTIAEPLGDAVVGARLCPAPGTTTGN